MKSINPLKQVILASVVAFATTIGIVHAATLPVCTVGVTCLQFGDFNVYSLPLLDLQSGGDGVPSPGDPFYFQSTYGAIKGDTILGINNGNFTSTGNPPGAMDGSYNTPSPNNATSGVFSTKDADAGGVLDPGPLPYFTPEFTGDTQNTWDSKTVNLLSLINGTPLTAFFAFNETGAGTGLDSTSLLTWAKITLEGPLGTIDFYLSSNVGGSGTNTTEADTSALPAAGGDPLSAAFNPWVYVHPGICTSGTNFVGFPDATGNCPLGTTLRQQNNLGQNAAAFMINSPALDAALNCKLPDGITPCYNVMHILWKMAYINGGGETAWFAPISSGGTFVPEPDSLALAGLGLVLLSMVGWRRRVHA